MRYQVLVAHGINHDGQQHETLTTFEAEPGDLIAVVGACKLMSATEAEDKGFLVEVIGDDELEEEDDEQDDEEIES